MKHLTLCAALLLCSNAQAATYVYQANAYQGHDGRCGGQLLPFQVTITVRKAIPPNSSNLIVSLKTLSIYAGENYQWGRRFNKQHTDGGAFTTDPDGHITEWNVAGATNHRRGFYTQNQTGDVRDFVQFMCGSAGGAGDPGTWTRTK